MGKNPSKLLFLAIIILAGMLRLYALATTPSSLYWDEASLGYNAYSILETARDEFGNFLPSTNFPAFGDYKPPGYIYLTVPSIALFGLNEFAIRFPSAFFGVLTVVITYFLTYKLFKKEKIALFAALFLAISPWHLQFSRGAFEANLGLFFSLSGIYFFIKFAKDNSLFLLASALSFILAMYTFTGQRLFVPPILLVLTMIFYKEIYRKKIIVIVASIVSIILFWPLLIFATHTQQGKLRFDEVSIFKNLDPINYSIKLREQDSFSYISNFIHNRRLIYTREYLSHYFDAFNLNFLLTSGDVNPRLSIQEMGNLYLFEFILAIMGIYFLFINKQKYRYLLILWLLVSPLGPATAKETPHALRMIHVLPTFQILAAFGLSILLSLKFANFIKVAILPFVVILFFYYLHIYYVHWPKTYSGEWQYGYKEAVNFSKKYFDEVDEIIVTPSLGRPYIYFLLYYPIHPETFWLNSNIEVDRFYFIHVHSIGKFKFTNMESSASRVLYILSPNQLPKEAKKLKTIYNLEGSAVFDIGIKR